MGIATENTQLCTFRVGGVLLGVDVLDVQEVLYRADVTSVPTAQAAVSGLINLRGQIATAVDLRTRLEMPPRPPGRRPTHVVVRSGDEAVSLLVDAIGDVIDVDPDRYEAPPDTLGQPGAELTLGAYKLDDELLMLLDVERTVRPTTTTEGGDR